MKTQERLHEIIATLNCLFVWMDAYKIPCQSGNSNMFSIKENNDLEKSNKNH